MLEKKRKQTEKYPVTRMPYVDSRIFLHTYKIKKIKDK
jgi:hypothetical protein